MRPPVNLSPGQKDYAVYLPAISSFYSTYVAKQRVSEFVFAMGVNGKLDRGWTWPVMPILSILKIADVNNTKMSLSNEGAIQITLDSGLATYKYIIPAQAA